MFNAYFERFKNEGIRINGKTIHASKGLEAKVVFIIGLVDGSGGFPDVWLDDRIFQVIKKSDVDLLLEEERRLFYVAITRAKEKLFLITEKGNESSFIKEIPSIYTVRNINELLPIVNKLILCKKCSSQLEGLYKFCPYCGLKIQSNDKKTYKTPVRLGATLRSSMASASKSKSGSLMMRLRRRRINARQQRRHSRASRTARSARLGMRA
jgi:hypothetical protein